MVDAARQGSSSGELRSIEYHNTAEDLTELHAASWWYYRWLRRVPILAIITLLALLLDYFVRGYQPPRELLFPLFAVALLSSLLRDSEERRFRWMFQMMQDPGRQRAALSPASFLAGFPPQEVAWSWKQVDRIEGDDRCLYFHCAERTERGEVYVIPRRAFRTPALADEFLAVGRRYWTLARSNEG
jgi:hypothetical protein